MRLNQIHILKAIYKHKALTINQLAILFDKHFKTIIQHLNKLIEHNFVNKVKNYQGIYYFLTSAGGRRVGLSRAYRVKHINHNHTDFEISVLRKLINSKEIIFNDYDELLDLYETDRDLKKRYFEEMGRKGTQNRAVDLLVKSKSGKIAYEIELTKKEKYKYKKICKKLDNQFHEEKWEKIIWIVKKGYLNWFKNTLEEANLSSNASLLKTDNFSSNFSREEKKRYGAK